MIRKPSCECGTCRRCRTRLSTQRWRERYPERVREGNRAYYQRHKAKLLNRSAPEKRKAQKLVYTEVRAGRMRPGACEIGTGCSGPMHGHHDDYSKPLDVRWLCARHHALEHAAEPLPVTA